MAHNEANRRALTLSPQPIIITSHAHSDTLHDNTVALPMLSLACDRHLPVKLVWLHCSLQLLPPPPSTRMRFLAVDC